MTHGIMLNMGLFSYVLVGVFGLIIIGLVGFELHRVFIKKQDRKFWEGISILFVTYISVSVFQFSVDSMVKYKIESTLEGEHIALTGSISYEALLNEFGIEDSSGCVVNNSKESEQCRFLMMFKSSEEQFANFISSDKRSVVRYGFWPHDSQFEFPAFKLNN